MILPCQSVRNDELVGFETEGQESKHTFTTVEAVSVQK